MTSGGRDRTQQRDVINNTEVQQGVQKTPKCKSHFRRTEADYDRVFAHQVLVVDFSLDPTYNSIVIELLLLSLTHG